MMRLRKRRWLVATKDGGGGERETSDVHAHSPTRSSIHADPQSVRQFVISSFTRLPVHQARNGKLEDAQRRKAPLTNPNQNRGLNRYPGL